MWLVWLMVFLGVVFTWRHFGNSTPKPLTKEQHQLYQKLLNKILSSNLIESGTFTIPTIVIEFELLPTYYRRWNKYKITVLTSVVGKNGGVVTRGAHTLDFLIDPKNPDMTRVLLSGEIVNFNRLDYLGREITSDRYLTNLALFNRIVDLIIWTGESLTIQGMGTPLPKAEAISLIGISQGNSWSRFYSNREWPVVLTLIDWSDIVVRKQFIRHNLVSYLLHSFTDTPPLMPGHLVWHRDAVREITLPQYIVVRELTAAEKYRNTSFEWNPEATHVLQRLSDGLESTVNFDSSYVAMTIGFAGVYFELESTVNNIDSTIIEGILECKN